MLVKNDREVQSCLLAMVRMKIGEHYQYTESSIPFELMQNADDASVELVEMEPSAQADDFLVKETPQTLCFGHNGRPINHYKSFEGTSYRDRGYQEDLENMLVLQRSGKGGEGEISRTGKFGMGFKSVFLACDKVEVKSGNRYFEVLGGMYPNPIPPNEGAVTGFDTVVTLTPKASNASAKEWRENILKEFRDHLPVLLVFLRQIRTVMWQNLKGDLRRLTWQGKTM